MTRSQKLWLRSVWAVAACCTSTAAFGQGADVIVGELPDLTNNNNDTVSGVIYDAFSVGTTSCNKGTVPLLWETGGTNNRHPVIAQNLFRLHNGRFEQIGQAWLKHGFTALQGNACGLGCTANPDGTRLGVGCSDPYSSGLNNSQSGLGPKWQVNAATGLFPYPFANSSGSGNTYKRLRVRSADLGASGARYFIEGHYVAGDDAAAGNKNNNASYREVALSGTAPNFSISSFIGSTVRELPAIFAWAAVDPTVQISVADIPGDGRFILASKVTNNGNGTFTYDYALHNLNSHRCAGAFIVPLPGAQPALTNIEFKDVEYHSGEPNQLADVTNPTADDWVVGGGGANANAVSWNGPAYAGTPPVYTVSGTTPYLVTSFTPGTGNDHTANVLRWGTMFNYRFTTTVAPADGNVQVNLWRPGTPTSTLINIRTPGGAVAGVLTGTCCVGTACSVQSQTACASAGGSFIAVGATCSPDPCATGSCCVASTGACSVTTEAACSNVWTSGAICLPNPCPQPTGSCCVSGSCSVTTQAACSGLWTNGGACTPGLCTLGSCCVANTGACSITTQSACTANWTSGPTTCTPNPCPQPTGSCCVAGSCSVTTQAACSGTWTFGLGCSPDPCAVGANDACSLAIPLCDGVAYSGTTLGATNDGTSSCGQTTTSPDVWFTYTPSGSSGTVTCRISTCGSGFDTVLSVHTACGNPSSACNDDSAFCGSGSFQSSLNLSLTRGVTYRIRVAGFQGATGPYSILVTGGGGTGCQQLGACCVGTSCTQTTQAQCSGGWSSGTCSPNPCDPTGACCVGTACSITTVTTCSGTFTVGGTCGPNTCDPLGSCCIQGNCTQTTASGCTAGGTSWTSGAACSPNPCPPQTDNCDERAGVGLGSTPFDTTNATTDGPTHALCLGSGDNNVGKDIWFNFPSLFDGTLTISLCGSTYDTKMAVYEGAGCMNLESRLLACNDDALCDGANSLQSVISIPVVCGQSYTIRIGGWTNGQGVTAAGAGTMTISAVENAMGSCCAPSGDCNVTHQSCCQSAWTSGATCSPNPCPQPTGACCNPNTGGCSIATHAACGAGQGLYQGDGSSCTPNPCVQPMGACCLPDGSCLETAFGACSGSYMGNNTSCSPNPCPQPTGACCNADGSCSVVTQANCSGTWTGGGNCSPNPCPQPMGACCDASTGSCSVVTQANCSGTWTGGGNCTPNPCPQPAGACCCGSSCTITLPAQCSGPTSAFAGSGTSCTPYSVNAPCCRGDYNRSSVTSVQDIFDFLAAYFANDPCSDSNDSNSSSVQDIFDFLAAYFAGCN